MQRLGPKCHLRDMRYGARQGSEWAHLLGLGSDSVPTSGSVSFLWRKPSFFGRTYDLLGPGDTPAGHVERSSLWGMHLELRLALPNGDTQQVRSEGNIFTKEYHVTNQRGDWLALWQRSWGRRRIRIGELDLRVVRAGVFSPWWQAETADGTVAIRWRERWHGWRRDLEVTVYPNELPDLKPDDWLTLTLLALHISLDHYKSRSS